MVLGPPPAVSRPLSPLSRVPLTWRLQPHTAGNACEEMQSMGTGWGCGGMENGKRPEEEEWRRGMELEG